MNRKSTYHFSNPTISTILTDWHNMFLLLGSVVKKKDPRHIVDHLLHCRTMRCIQGGSLSKGCWRWAGKEKFTRWWLFTNPSEKYWWNRSDALHQRSTWNEKKAPFSWSSLKQHQQAEMILFKAVSAFLKETVDCVVRILNQTSVFYPFMFLFQLENTKEKNQKHTSLVVFLHPFEKWHAASNWVHLPQRFGVEHLQEMTWSTEIGATHFHHETYGNNKPRNWPTKRGHMAYDFTHFFWQRSFLRMLRSNLRKELKTKLRMLNALDILIYSV